MKLAAVIITYNEAHNISRCLESVHFCDEVVVVDSNSQDDTIAIAKRYTTHVYSRQWEGYAAQKNYAVSLTSADWILSIDADEVVSSALADEILSVIGKNGVCDAFSIPRKTIHFGRWIRYGGWYPNRLVRLCRQGRGVWIGDQLHERWEITGEVGTLRNDLLHYSFRNLADQVQRNNQYSSLGARHLKQMGAQYSLSKLLLKPITKFGETYLLKRGFLDGFPGFIISVSAAYSVFLKWAKLWELENGSQEV